MSAAGRIVVLTQLEASACDASDAEVEEYAEFLGIDLELERDLFPLARAGLVANLPEHWVPCRVEGTEDDLYFNHDFYFNQQTGESIWDHPLDHVFRRRVVEVREQRRCYLVSLALLDDDKVQGTNLAGDVVVSVAGALDESYGDVEDRLRSAVVVADDDRVLCFTRAGGKLIGFSGRSKRVQDVFGQDCEDQHGVFAL